MKNLAIMKNHLDIFQTVTDKIIQKLEQGVIPWTDGLNSKTARFPTNFITNRAYRGINILMLWMDDFHSPYYATYKQINDAGGYVKKGEKSSPVVYYHFVIRHRENNRKISLVDYNNLSNADKDVYNVKSYMRFYDVFNIEQTEGLSPVSKAVSVDYIENYSDGPDIKHMACTPSYNPVKDMVYMPHRNDYQNDGHFYATLYHELVHSTGHASRLKRDDFHAPQSFRSESYSFEELVAELGTSFLLSHFNLYNEDLLDNSASYIKGWLSVFKSDNKVLFKAASEAQKAFDYILGG